MKRTNINLREHQHKALAASSQKTGATVSELIRRAIDEYLKKKQSTSLKTIRLWSDSRCGAGLRAFGD